MVDAARMLNALALSSIVCLVSRNAHSVMMRGTVVGNVNGYTGRNIGVHAYWLVTVIILLDNMTMTVKEN
jgi:hypothetical protein